MISQCKHKVKEKLNTGVIENIVNLKYGGIPTTYVLNKFEIYLCHDCKCIVWSEVTNG